MVVEEGMLSPHAGGTPPSEAMRRQSIDKARVRLPAPPGLVHFTLLLRCSQLVFNILNSGSVTAAGHCCPVTSNTMPVANWTRLLGHAVMPCIVIGLA